jgi:hypothetical protein
MTESADGIATEGVRRQVAADGGHMRPAQGRRRQQHAVAGDGDPVGRHDDGLLLAECSEAGLDGR